MEQMETFFNDHPHNVHFKESVDDSSLLSLNEIQDASCVNLITELLSPGIFNFSFSCSSFLIFADPKKRYTVSMVLDHPYLVKGYLSSHETNIQEIKGKESPAISSSLSTLNPRILYHLPPPVWPAYDAQNTSKTDDKWARRQFSSLWAPMPAQYNLTGSVSLSGVNSCVFCS
jgi:hypothetical protein